MDHPAVDIHPIRVRLRQGVVMILLLGMTAWCLPEPQASAADRQKAVEAFQAAVAIRPAGEADLRRQAELFEKALALNPGLWEAAANLTMVYLALDDPERALGFAQKAVALKPEARPSRVGLCQCLRLLERWDEAAACLRDALAAFPGDTALAADLVWVRYRQEKWADVLTVIDQVPAVVADEQMRRIHLRSLVQAGRWPDVLAIAERYAGQGMAAAHRLPAIIRAATALGRPAAVVAAALEGLESETEPAARTFYLGFLAAAGRDVGAVPDLRGIYHRFQEQIRAEVTLAEDWARLLWQKQLTGDAASLAAWLVAEHPDAIAEEIFVMHASVQLEQGDAEGLAATAQAGLDYFPRSAELAYLAGEARLRQNLPDDAIMYLTRALNRDAVHRHALDSLRIACDLVNRLELAAPYYDGYLEQKPDDDEVHFYYAAMLCRLDRPDEALSHLETAVRLDPSRWVPVLRNEVQGIHSIFDCIRYRRRFAALLEEPERRP